MRFSEVCGGLYWRRLGGAIENGIFDFRISHVGALAIDEKSWSGNFRARIDGFSYKAILDSDFLFERGGAARWLARIAFGKDYCSQPYEHLAGLMQDAGRYEISREVLLQKEISRSKAGTSHIPWYEKIFRFSHCAITGYGVYPFRSLIIFLLLLYFSFFVFTLADFHGLLTCVSARASTPDPAISGASILPSMTAEASGASNHVCSVDFSSIFYPLDLLAPLIDFLQASSWGPTPGGSHYWPLFVFGAFLKVSGWALTLFLAEALVTSIRRR